MYMAYFDSSRRDNPEGSRLTVAGFISTSDKWERFSVKWQDRLDEWGLPFFHMAQCVAGKGRYEGWDESLRARRIHELIDIIERYALGSIAASVGMDAYHQYYQAKYPRGPYYLTATHLFGPTVDFLPKNSLSENIAYFFDRGDQGYPQTKAAFDEAYRNPSEQKRLRLMSCEQADKQKHLPLQAADIIAWELWQQWSVQYEGKGSTRRTMRRLMRSLMKEENWQNLDGRYLARRSQLELLKFK